MTPLTQVPAKKRCLVGLIGNGVEFSLTPSMHELEGDALGLRYMYVTIDLERIGLSAGDAVRLLEQTQRLGFAGLNITHPCKRVVAEHVDELSPEAALLGSVNTVVFSDGRSIGHNTDGSAFRTSFERGLPDAAVENVTILGAGGAGAALAHVVLDMGVGKLTVVDTDTTRADAVCRSMSERFGADRCKASLAVDLQEAIGGADGVINATPLGMVGHEGVPFDLGLLRGDQWVADIVYRPLETPLLSAARARGCRVLDGGGMAVFQAVDAFRLFSGMEPDLTRMFAHFSNLAAVAGELPDTAWWLGEVAEV